MLRKVSMDVVGRDEPRKLQDVIALANFPVAEWGVKLKSKASLKVLRRMAVVLFGSSAQTDELRLARTNAPVSFVLESVRVPRTHMS